MNRHQRFSFGMLLASLVLTGCSRTPRPISAEELLRRTIVANQSINARGFSADTSFALGALSGSLTGSGSLERGGETWSFDGEASIARATGNAYERLRARFLASEREGKRHLFVLSMHGFIADALTAAARRSMTGQWIDIGSTEPAPHPPTGLTIDPEFIEQTIGSFRPLGEPTVVSGDHGQYQYSLSVLFATGAGLGSPEGGGSLLVDADSFRLRQVSWRIDRVTLPVGDLRLSAELRFFDGAHEGGKPPTGSGATSLESDRGGALTLSIPLESILHIIFGSSPVP